MILQFKEGDEAAFNAIYKHFYGSLYKFCHAIVQSGDEARDITAEVFALLWKMREQWETYVNVRAFLYLTIRNRSFNYLKSQKTRSDIEKRIADISNTEQRLMLFSQVESEMIIRIREAVAQLPDYYRNILKLSYEQGYKNQEIADELGISEKTVRNAKSIAMSHLKKVMLNRIITTIFMILCLCNGLIKDAGL